MGRSEAYLALNESHQLLWHLRLHASAVPSFDYKELAGVQLQKTDRGSPAVVATIALLPDRHEPVPLEISEASTDEGPAPAKQMRQFGAMDFPATEPGQGSQVAVPAEQFVELLDRRARSRRLAVSLQAPHGHATLERTKAASMPEDLRPCLLPRWPTHVNLTPWSAACPSDASCTASEGASRFPPASRCARPGTATPGPRQHRRKAGRRAFWQPRLRPATPLWRAAPGRSESARPVCRFDRQVSSHRQGLQRSTGGVPGSHFRPGVRGSARNAGYPEEKRANVYLSSS